jgi:hypothetical protein
MTIEDQELMYGFYIPNIRYAGIVAFGGQYSIELDEKRTTHLITMEFDPNISDHIIQILPHWFSDCLTVQRKVPLKAFTFPDPEVSRNLAETRFKSTFVYYLASQNLKFQKSVENQLTRFHLLHSSLDEQSIYRNHSIFLQLIILNYPSR